MNLDPQQADKLKQALSEMRTHQAHFSEVAFSQIVILLLDALRDAQTIDKPDSPLDAMRLVTVMFVDVKDSTEIIQRFDPGDWKGIIDDAQAQIADIVDQWGGQVAQYLGDGVLCFFGAQRSHGNDALHAVSCALQIQAAMNDYARVLRDAHDIPFDIRIGISTGRLAVGLIGKETVKQELLAFGRATNLAARLQGVAPTGGVLIDRATYQHIRRDFITQMQEPVTLRGFDDVVTPYYVVEQRKQSANYFTDTHISGIEIPLVGREEDVALINYIIDRVVQKPQCHLITISGDVGVGKSRLLQEIIQMTAGQFTQIVINSPIGAGHRMQNLFLNLLTTQCDLHENVSQNTVFHEIHTCLTQLWSDEHDKRVITAFMRLAGLQADTGQDEDRQWVFHWFEQVVKQQPLIIAVDDLQWLDSQSVQFLQELAQHLQDYACLIITAGRPVYRTGKPHVMVKSPYQTAIKLDLLAADETLAMINTVFSQVERVPQTLAETINRRVEGNPLFVQEYLMMLFDHQVFVPHDPAGWHFNIIMLDTALEQIPNRLLNILQTQLDDLSPDTRAVIQVASICGYYFWGSSIDAILDIQSGYERLELLAARGMIVPDTQSMLEGERQYRFRYSIYQKAAYKLMTRAQREAYHQKMADWLLSRVAGQTDLYPLLAEQFIQSGHYLLALQAFSESVAVHLNRGHEQAALMLIDQSLGIANKIPRDEALSVVTKLWAMRSAALLSLQRYEEASAASQSALRLLDELAHPQFMDMRILSERILGLSNLSLGRYNDAYDTLTRAYNLLPIQATGQMATVLEALGKLYSYQGRLDDSYAYHKRALDDAIRVRDDHLAVEALLSIGSIYFERGNLADAIDHFKEGLQLAQAYQLSALTARALFYIGDVHLRNMTPRIAYECFAEAEAIHPVANRSQSLLYGARALALVMLEQRVQGRTLMRRALEQPPSDVNDANYLQTLNITSLIILQDHAQAREQSIALLSQDHLNPIIAARAKHYLSVTSDHLGIQNDMQTLHEAIEQETVLAGRDLWLHYYTLARLSSEPDECHYAYQQSAQLIRERLTLLQDHDDLYKAFWNNYLIQTILTQAQL